ncbi:MAG: cobalamin-binding protein [Planctomycetota bacterium]|nr:MAG: cobalamin-binding protein [Planctomycetota bacterium]
MSALRIVSLLPSSTEIVCALGLEEQLVGRSHECDFPASIADRPTLTRSRVSLPPSSAEIDRNVREMLRDVLAVYEIDEVALGELAPTLIVTQDLCDVCAVSFDDVLAATQRLACDDTQILSLRPTRLEHVLEDLRRVGAATGREQRAHDVVAGLQARLDALAARSAQLDTRPSVLTVEWVEPLMVGGTWMPQLVEIAGGRALCATTGEPAPTLSDAELDELAPDVVLVKPCGFDLARSNQELHVIRAKLMQRDWPAVRHGRVFLSDGNAYFNRPGPRLVESAEILAACLHPAAFPELVERHAAAVQQL